MIKLNKLIPLMLFLSSILLSQSWQNFYNGPANGDDESRSLCPDDSGNVYVTGNSMGNGSDIDIVTIKYGRNGNVIWTRIFNGTGNSTDKAFGVVQDENGFIYIGGYTTSSGGNEDVLLLCYNAAGTLSWSKVYNHSNSSSDKAWGIVVDNADRTYIYLTGCTLTGNDYNYLTLKYRDDGFFKWSKTYDRGSGSDDRAIGIVVDTDGHVIVTGYSQGSSSSYDYYTIKYNSDGAVLWSKRFNGTGNSDDRAFGIVSDHLNNIIVTGYNMRSTEIESRDIATIQYDKNGTVKWSKVYNGTGNLSDEAFGIVVDDVDNIYVAGSTQTENTSKDFLLLKYSTSGTEKWSSVFNSPASGSDAAYSLFVSPDGQSIYLAGSSIIAGSESISAAKFNSSGSLMQTMIYPGTGRATSITLSNRNNLYLGGYFINNGSGSMAPNKDFITMEFPDGFILISVTSINGEIPLDFVLHQNYPNPFNPSTRIRFDLPEASFVKLTVYNVSGEEISVLAEKQMQAGKYEASFTGKDLSSGVYFYKLIAGKHQTIRKMILVK